MFILLDAGYVSSFENDALKIPVREKINPKTQWASWEVRASPPTWRDFSSVLNYVMETLIFHYNYERSLNDQYVHTKALANSAQ